MNPFRIHFDELYRRHLCRHGDFGLNVLHVIAVVGIYFALAGLIDFGLKCFLPDTQRMIWLLCLTVPWLITLAFNVPIAVSLFSGLTTTALIAAVVFLPAIPAWIFVVLILLLHQFQQWGHKLYPMHNDMTEFRDKYPKGVPLFLLLSAYELPILIQFFLRWVSRSVTALQKPGNQ